MIDMDFYDYRTTLKKEFELRRGRNAFYSLRAFARDLGLSPARLSEVLAGKKGISSEAAESIALKLNLDRDEKELFSLSVDKLHSRSKSGKALAKAKLKAAVSAASSLKPKLSTIVGWSTDAIYKQSQREGFRSSPEAISRSLDIPIHWVDGAVRFLTRLGLWINVSAEKAYLAHRAQGKRLHIDYEQILEQARKSYLLQKSATDYFEHTALLLEENDLKRARTLVTNCFVELKKLEKRSKKAKVHFFASQLFCLENKKGENHDRKN